MVNYSLFIIHYSLLIILTPQPPLPRARGSSAPLSFRRGDGGEDTMPLIINN
jgi:hypothetical protein